MPRKSKRNTENQFFIFDRPYTSELKRTVNSISESFRSVCYKGMGLFSGKQRSEKKFHVSICAIFKNEAPYLREWIEFHRIVGIDHFYMYNNRSDDDFLNALRPYIEEGLVTLKEWPENQKQIECYIDCIENFAQETKWLGFIDIDEFVVPKSTDTVYDFLKDFEKNRGSVKIYWRFFGSSGIMERSRQGLVTEDFIVCWPKYCDIGKCFYNTAFDFSKDPNNIRGLHHILWTNWKGIEIPPVNIFDHVCAGYRNIADTMDFPIQINHYFTKSYQEYAAKKTKGDVYFHTNPHDEKYFFKHEMKCTATDYSAYKYLIKLKKAMAGKEDKYVETGDGGQGTEVRLLPGR